MAQRISNVNKAKLNKMNVAAQKVSLGTVIQDLGYVTTGSYTTVLADISGSSAVIWTAINPIGGAIVAATRSGSAIVGSGIKYSFSGSGITVSTGSAPAMALTVGDVITYVAFK